MTMLMLLFACYVGNKAEIVSGVFCSIGKLKKILYP